MFDFNLPEFMTGTAALIKAICSVIAALQKNPSTPSVTPPENEPPTTPTK